MIIQNSSTIKNIRSAAGLSLSEGFPQDLRNDIQAVINVNPKDYHNSLMYSTQKTNTGAMTAFASGATDFTYVYAVNLAVVKNALCDVATGSINITANIQDQGSVVIAAIPILTLNAENTIQSIRYDPPLKLQKGSSITSSTNSFTAGAMSRTLSISYDQISDFEN